MRPGLCKTGLMAGLKFGTGFSNYNSTGDHHNIIIFRKKKQNYMG